MPLASHSHPSAVIFPFGIYLCCLTWVRTFCISPRLNIDLYQSSSYLRVLFLKALGF